MRPKAFQEEPPQYETVKHFVEDRMLPLLENVRSA